MGTEEPARAFVASESEAANVRCRRVLSASVTNHAKWRGFGLKEGCETMYDASVLKTAFLFAFLLMLGCRPPIAAYAPGPNASDFCPNHEAFSFYADHSFASELSVTRDIETAKPVTRKGKWDPTPDGSTLVLGVDPALWAQELRILGMNGGAYGSYANIAEGKIWLRIALAHDSSPYLNWMGCLFYFQPERKVADAASGLIVRSAPSTNAPQLALMAKGSAVEVFGCVGPNETIYGITAPWCSVKFGETRGWAFGGFLQ